MGKVHGLANGANGAVQELRIHDETERGDNDTIKKAGRGLCGS